MNQAAKSRKFSDLHVKGNPVLLYNIWDAASAKAVETAGAKAIATGSWSVAGAQGFSDGEKIPLDFLEQIVKQITGTTDLPVSIDFEGGYANDPKDVATNVARIIGAGAAGINFEDQVVGGDGLHDIGHQQSRIAAIREAADGLGIPLVINARTDLFLKASDRSEHPSLVENALSRADAYKTAGASSFFVPGLVNEGLISDICAATTLPVNIMMMDGAPALARLAQLGVARVSYGPGPFRSLMKMLEETARAILN